MKQGFGYCRVSSVGQSADGRDGIPRQKEAIKKYASANGIRIVRWFVDSITGKSDLEHRPALQELLDAANGVKLIVIEKVDRLARDLMIQESIIADLKKKEFEVVSTLEPDLCSDEPTRVLMRQMMGAFSQYERAMISAKLKEAKQRARANNPDYREGRKPYGTHPDYPEERKTIARVLELRENGVTLAGIAAMLNAEGRKTRSGGRWFEQQVVRVIRRTKV